jgi:hypothetical protein
MKFVRSDLSIDAKDTFWWKYFVCLIRDESPRMSESIFLKKWSGGEI